MLPDKVFCHKSVLYTVVVVPDLQVNIVVLLQDGVVRVALLVQLSTHLIQYSVPSVSPTQANATFPYLAALKTLEVDELYLLPCVDRFLEALRMEGVNVSTFYRSNMRSFYGRREYSIGIGYLLSKHHPLSLAF